MSDDVPDNIDRFNRLTLALLTILYADFPTPIDIDPKVIGANASGDDFEGDGGRERAFTWIDAAGNTMAWLHDEGFFREQRQTLDGKHLQVVLSIKGLATLGHIPHSIKENPEKSSFGTLAGKTLKSGAKDIISEFVKEIINIGAKATMGHYGI
ncbi:MAG: hypothetical protein P4L92_11760 [Rudaea sp.]|nr:hypothetical protein [Rudaea sp.]